VHDSEMGTLMAFSVRGVRVHRESVPEVACRMPAVDIPLTRLLIPLLSLFVWWADHP
jgi:hypothetical protein